MCEKNECCCQKPEELKTIPTECSPEQIIKCHGEGNDHPCVPKKDEK
jgi:hypothetical protein